MKNTIDDNLFTTIRKSLEKAPRTSSNVLKLEIGKKYRVRLLPNKKSPAKTFKEYVTYAFDSFATGENIWYTSPETNGESDACGIVRSKFWKAKNEEMARKIKRKVVRYINVYVVEDGTTPENNGQVKILKLNKDLDKKIDEAMNDEDGEGGKSIFDLSDEGRDFLITVTKKGEYADYSLSKFSSKRSLNLTNEACDKILASIHDLDSIYRPISTEQTQEYASKHLLLEKAPAASAPKKTENKKSNDEDESIDESTSEEMDALLKDMGL